MNKASNGDIQNEEAFRNNQVSNKYVVAAAIKKIVIFIQSFDVPEIPV